MSLPSILQRAASYGFTSHFYHCHKNCPICFESFQTLMITTASGKKITWTRSSLNVTRCARGYYLLQLLLELHGPHDDGTPHSVLHALHVGVHAVQGEHLSRARAPVHRMLRHVCFVTGVSASSEDWKTKKLEECSRADTGEVYQTSPDVRPTPPSNLCLKLELLWYLAVLSATTPTHPALPLLIGGELQEAQTLFVPSQIRTLRRFGPTAKYHQGYLWTNYSFKKKKKKSRMKSV